MDFQLSQISPFELIRGLVIDRPEAVANISGSTAYPSIRGRVYFYQTPLGVIVVALVSGLPAGRGRCDDRIFAMHIHSGGSCTGTPDDPFAFAEGHYNPGSCPIRITLATCPLSSATEALPGAPFSQTASV